MRPYLRFAIAGPLAAILFLMQQPQLRQDPALLPAAVQCITLLLCVFTFARPQHALTLLGFVLCTGAALGASALGLLVLGWIFGLELRRLQGTPFPLAESQRLIAVGAILFIWLCIASSMLPAMQSFDITLLQSINFHGGLYAVVRYLHATFRDWREIPLVLAAMIQAVWLISNFGPASANSTQLGSKANYHRFLDGLAAGAIAAAFVVVLQMLKVHPIFAMNRSVFWEMIGRYPATFSDPNAFGIFGCLVFCLLLTGGFGRKSKLYKFSALVLLPALIWSGSRTAWLGICGWGFLILCSAAKNWTVRSRIAFASICVLSIGAIALAGYPPVNEALSAKPLPVGIKRMVDLAHWSKGGEGFTSRAVFSAIALEVWRQHPVSGAGFKQFYDAQSSAAEKLAIDLGEWRDNANNFYLQILAETGVAGILVCGLAIYLIACGICSNDYRSGTSVFDRLRGEALWFKGVRRLLFVFLFLLLTGPHLDFEEVRYLVLALCVLAVAPEESAPQDLRSEAVAESRIRKRLRLAWIAAAAIFPLYLVAGWYSRDLQAPRGFYGVEQSPEGDQRWTAGNAVLKLCGHSGPIVLQINPLRPGIENAPVKVSISRSGPELAEQKTSVELKSNIWHAIPVPAGNSSAPGAAEVRLNVEPLWGPDQRPPGDPRWLGVLLRIPEDSCDYKKTQVVPALRSSK